MQKRNSCHRHFTSHYVNSYWYRPLFLPLHQYENSPHFHLYFPLLLIKRIFLTIKSFVSWQSCPFTRRNMVVFNPNGLKDYLSRKWFLLIYLDICIAYKQTRQQKSMYGYIYHVHWTLMRLSNDNKCTNSEIQLGLFPPSSYTCAYQFNNVTKPHYTTSPLFKEEISDGNQQCLNIKSSSVSESI